MLGVSKNKKDLFIGIVLLISLIVLGFSLNDHWLTVLIVMLLTACNAVAWNLCFGYAGIFSLGHHAFFGIGSYISTILFINSGLSPWIGLIIAAIGSAFIATIVSIIGFRYKLSGVFFALFTMSLSLVLASVINGLEWLGGPAGLLLPTQNNPSNFLFYSRIPYFFIILGILIIFMIITYYIENTKFGYFLKAIREDEDAAEASGIDSYKYKILIMALSASMAGIVGTFYAQFMLFIAPNVVFDFHIQLNMLIGVLLGGAGTLWGPLIGSGIFSIISEVLRNLPFENSTQIASLSMMINALILMLVVLYLPKGIVSLNIRGLNISKNKVLNKRINRGNIKNQNGEKKMFIEVNNITKKFGGLIAVNDVSFSVSEGEIFGIIGPNGAGKTTLFNCLTGVYTPEEGEARIDDIKITGLKPHKICRLGIGRTFQITKPFPGLTVEETILIGALNKLKNMNEAKKLVEEILIKLDLSNKRYTRGESLTVVERKRLELARALASKPKVLLLDEVVAGLNPSEVDVIIELIKNINQSGITIIMIEHVLRAVFGLSNRIIVLNHGKKIAEGTPEEVVEVPEVVSAYIGGD